MEHSLAQNDLLENIEHIKIVAERLFPEPPVEITRVSEGVSTYVYRIRTEQKTFYLRILPEEDASFSPEVAAHNRLRELGLKVPRVVYFEECNELVQRSIMVTEEIKGRPVSQAHGLSPEVRERIVTEAGRDLARINSVSVAGFGWIVPEHADAGIEGLRAEEATFWAFVQPGWDEDLTYMAEQGLAEAEVDWLEQIAQRYDSWLDVAEGSLAHGDFDTTHIFEENGRYTGIIDFGEIRGADRWYDLGHFHLRDGEQLPQRLLPALLRGYGQEFDLTADYMERIQFASLLINVRLLARSLRKRPANRYTKRQFETLRADAMALSMARSGHSTL